MYGKVTSRLTLTAAISLAAAFLFAACAPTYAPHMDAPAMPTLDSTAVETECRKQTLKIIAPLDPPPQLPDVEPSLSWCPPGSGFVACFTAEQNAIRQQRFKLLHDDRDYCRDAYERARERASEK
jgi:hypothetical protein